MNRIKYEKLKKTITRAHEIIAEFKIHKANTDSYGMEIILHSLEMRRLKMIKLFEDVAKNDPQMVTIDDIRAMTVCFFTKDKVQIFTKRNGVAYFPDFTERHGRTSIIQTIVRIFHNDAWWDVVVADMRDDDNRNLAIKRLIRSAYSTMLVHKPVEVHDKKSLMQCTEEYRLTRNSKFL
jgi:hypothetical protein